MARYRERGLAGIVEDARHGTHAMLTPRSREVMVASAKRRRSAQGIREDLQDFYRERGEPERSVAAVRTIRRSLHTAGFKFVRRPSHFLVASPWSALWRFEFCQRMLALLRERRSLLRRIVFIDEKKFSLWDIGHGRWVEEDREPNVAKQLGMSWEEYGQYLDEHYKPGASKQRGRNKVMAIGAVGYNFKSMLYLLDSGQKLNAPLYAHILACHILPEAYKAMACRKLTRAQEEMMLEQDPLPSRAAPERRRRRRAQRRCGECRQSGHDKRTCPQLGRGPAAAPVARVRRSARLRGADAAAPTGDDDGAAAAATAKDPFYCVYCNLRGHHYPYTNVPRVNHDRPDSRIFLVQDNDPSHWTEEVIKAISPYTYLVRAARRDEHGRQARNPWKTGRGANQPSLPRFPPYSPDINWAIEKVWRYMAFQINEVVDEGNLRGGRGMREAVEQLWDSVPFRRVPGYVGINYYVENWGDVLRAVMNEDGYDTRYMK